MAGSFNKPKGVLSARDLERYVYSTPHFIRKVMGELYDKLNNGIKCGMHNGDIVAIDNHNSKHAVMLFLRESALDRFIKATGMTQIHDVGSVKMDYMGVYAALDIFAATPVTKLRFLFEKVYDDLQSGKIKENVLPKDAIRKLVTEKRATYSIQKDPIVLKKFAALCKLEFKEGVLSLIEDTINFNNMSKTKTFESASQVVRDAWGDEWTTTYSRMPHGKDDR